MPRPPQTLVDCLLGRYDEHDTSFRTQDPFAVDHVSGEQISQPFLLVLSLSARLQLLNVNHSFFRQVETSPVALGVNRDQRRTVAGDVYFVAVQVANHSVADAVATIDFTSVSLLSEAVDAQQVVLLNRRDNEATTHSRYVRVIQSLNHLADTGVGQCSTVTNSVVVRSLTVRTDNSSVVRAVVSGVLNSRARAVDAGTVQAFGLSVQIGVNLLSEGITGVVSVESAEAVFGLNVSDVFDQSAVLPVLVDYVVALKLLVGDQSNDVLNGLGRSVTANRTRDVSFCYLSHS